MAVDFCFLSLPRLGWSPLTTECKKEMSICLFVYLFIPSKNDLFVNPVKGVVNSFTGSLKVLGVNYLSQDLSLEFSLLFSPKESCKDRATTKG